MYTIRLAWSLLRSISIFSVPKWLLQGDCHLSAWRASMTKPEVVQGGQLNQVIYYPHNDSARIEYECLGREMRTRQCKFMGKVRKSATL